MEETGGTPPRGSLAWRRMVLEVCAADSADPYKAAMEAAWEVHGWRAAVDVVAEMLGSITRLVGAKADLRDAYGNVKMQELAPPLEPESELKFAAMVAEQEWPDLPPHEAMRLALESGDRVRGLMVTARTVWRQCIEAITVAGGDPQAAWPVLMTHLRTYEAGEKREGAALEFALLTHAVMRINAFPRGSAWIDYLLQPPGPDELAGSMAAYMTADPISADRLMAPFEMTEHHPRGADDPPPRRRKGSAARR